MVYSYGTRLLDYSKHVKIQPGCRTNTSANLSLFTRLRTPDSSTNPSYPTRMNKCPPLYFLLWVQEEAMSGVEKARLRLLEVSGHGPSSMHLQECFAALQEPH